MIKTEHAHRKVAVVGSGPGGCVAATLIAEAGIDVIMIEEGDYFQLDDIKMFSTDEMQKKYRNGGITFAMGKPKISYVEGMAVGGGSEVNSGLYHRIPDEVLEKWERRNNLSIDREVLGKCYSRIEEDLTISYMPSDQIPLSSLKLAEGAKQLGWKCAEIPRWFKYSNMKSRKQSMTETYIPRFLKANGSLQYRCRVDRIVKQGKGFKINYWDYKQNRRESLLTDYVILASGAIQTAVTLLRSGIKKNVGKSLKLHPTFKFTALFESDVNVSEVGVPVHQVKEFSPEISIGCSISSIPYLGISLNDTLSFDYISQWRQMSTYYSMISPQGSGSVTLLPFFKSPKVAFKLSRKDENNIRKGYRILANVLFEAGALKLFPSVNRHVTINHMGDLVQLDEMKISNFNLMTIHLFGSVPMGGSRHLSALNENGEVWDVRKLYVCDGSALCESPSVNPQGTIMAFSMMNTMKFIDRLRNESQF